MHLWVAGNLVTVGAPEFVGATTVPLMAIEVSTTASTTVKTISAIKIVSSVIIRIPGVMTTSVIVSVSSMIPWCPSSAATMVVVVLLLLLLVTTIIPTI